MELDVYCPLSGKSCTTTCAWCIDDCSLRNLFYMAHRMDDIAGQLEEIKDNIENLKDTIGSY